MIRKTLFIIILSPWFFQFLACNKQPYKPKTTLVAGYVIGKETCDTSEANDYWLVDLTYRPNTPEYGDTLTFNGQQYTNVVKTKGLRDTVKHVGIAVDIEFNKITSNTVETTGCNVANPKTYNLKEIFVFNLGEIR